MCYPQSNYYQQFAPLGATGYGSRMLTGARAAPTLDIGNLPPTPAAQPAAQRAAPTDTLRDILAGLPDIQGALGGRFLGGFEEEDEFGVAPTRSALLGLTQGMRGPAPLPATATRDIRGQWTIPQSPLTQALAMPQTRYKYPISSPTYPSRFPVM